MKHALILALASLLSFLGACGGSGPELPGVYTVDTTTLEAAFKEDLAALPAPQRAIMEAKLPQMVEVFSSQRFSFDADGSLELKASTEDGAPTRTGSWALEGAALTVTFEGSPPQEATYEDGVITLVFDDGPGGGKAITIHLRKE